MSKPRELCIPDEYHEDSLDVIVEQQTLGHKYTWFIEKSAVEKAKRRSDKLAEAMEESYTAYQCPIIGKALKDYRGEVDTKGRPISEGTEL